MDPSGNSFDTEAERLDTRRDALKKLGVGAAVAWSVPVVMGGVAHAAGTPPPPVPCLLCGSLSPIANNNADSGTTGWTYTSGAGGSLTVQNYTVGFPAPVPAAAPRYFQLLGQPAPAGSVSTGTMSQRIFVPSACEGKNVRFSGYYSNGGNSSSVVTSVEFRNNNGNLISSLTNTRAFSTTAMTAFARTGTVPVGTRIIDVKFTTNRTATGVVQQALSRIDLVDLRCF